MPLVGLSHYFKSLTSERFFRYSRVNYITCDLQLLPFFTWLKIFWALIRLLNFLGAKPASRDCKNLRLYPNVTWVQDIKTMACSPGDQLRLLRRSREDGDNIWWTEQLHAMLILRPLSERLSPFRSPILWSCDSMAVLTMLTPLGSGSGTSTWKHPCFSGAASSRRSACCLMKL